jgi:hypothetical protein
MARHWHPPRQNHGSSIAGIFSGNWISGIFSGIQGGGANSLGMADLRRNAWENNAIK